VGDVYALSIVHYDPDGGDYGDHLLIYGKGDGDACRQVLHAVVQSPVLRKFRRHGFHGFQHTVRHVDAPAGNVVPDLVDILLRSGRPKASLHFFVSLRHALRLRISAKIPRPSTNFLRSAPAELSLLS
jgi:hypothetical protein